MKFNHIIRCSALLIALFAITFSACKKNTEEEPPYFTEAELAELRANTCLTEGADDPYAMSETPESGVQDRAAGAKNKFWAPGSTLRVRFLNGSAAMQNKVFAYAEQWEAYANINFVRVTSGASDIRVKFGTEGNNSQVGINNRDISPNLQTMNLAFTTNTKNEDIQGTTLHEFGHALGLNHEQQQPLANIPWNVQAVYSFYMAPPINWTKDRIDRNILNKATWESSQHTAYDSKSIMQYKVDAKLTTNGFSIPDNNILSSTDKDFISKMYSSQRIRVRHAVNTTSPLTFWLNGIYHTLAANESLWVPAKTSGNQLSIWECVGSNCAWDGYVPTYGKNYKIVAQGSTGNLTLAND